MAQPIRGIFTPHMVPLDQNGNINEDELGEPEVFAMFLDPRVKSRGGTVIKKTIG